MEQILGIILTLVLSGIIAIAKERKKRKEAPRRVFEPDDFTLAPTDIPPPPSRSFIPKIPEEGERVTADAQPVPQPELPIEDEAAMAHRERWRRAIIDAEILTRKF